MESTNTPLTLDDLRTQREEILALAARYGATNLRVFGSIARGEAGPASDVDLLVTFSSGTTLFELSNLWQDLEDLLGRKVNIVSEAGLRDRFRQRIERDLVQL